MSVKSKTLPDLVTSVCMAVVDTDDTVSIDHGSSVSHLLLDAKMSAEKPGMENSFVAVAPGEGMSCVVSDVGTIASVNVFMFEVLLTAKVTDTHSNKA